MLVYIGIVSGRNLSPARERQNIIKGGTAPMSDDASPAPAQPGCKGKGSERLVVNFESEPDCRLWRTRSSLGKKLHHEANSSKCTFGGSLVVNGYFALASWEVPPGLKRGKSQPLFGAHGLVLKAKADGRALQYNVTIRTGKMINNRLEGGFEVCVVFSHQSPHAHRARMLPEPACSQSPHASFCPTPHLLPSVAIVFSVFFFFSVCFFSTLASCVFSPRTSTAHPHRVHLFFPHSVRAFDCGGRVASGGVLAPLLLIRASHTSPHRS